MLRPKKLTLHEASLQGWMVLMEAIDALLQPLAMEKRKDDITQRNLLLLRIQLLLALLRDSLIFY